MRTAVDMSRLIDTIYAAGESGDGWNECLDRLRLALGATGAHLFICNDACVVLGSTQVDSGALAAYGSHFHRLNPWEARLSARPIPVGRVLPGQALLPHAELKKTEYYSDFARRYELTRALFGVAGSRLTRSRFAITVNRGDRQQEFDDEAVALLGALIPHLGRALEVRVRWALADQKQEATLEALDVLPFGVMLVDGDAKVCLANARASALLARQDGIATDACRLRGANAAVTRQLRGLCAEIAATRAELQPHSGATLNLPRASGTTPLQLMIAPVVSHGALAMPGHDIAAVIYISDPAEVVIPDETLLRDGFGLSPAESRVAARVAAGRSVEEIGEELGYTRETARWYVKQVLAKAGCRTRSEFAARAARSIALLRRHNPTDG